MYTEIEKEDEVKDIEMTFSITSTEVKAYLEAGWKIVKEDALTVTIRKELKA